jgi:type I restriction enzyme, R subunit
LNKGRGCSGAAAPNERRPHVQPRRGFKIAAGGGELDEESTRAMREGLDEETLALFDLLKKPELDKKDIESIKKVAIELEAILRQKKKEIDDWRAKEQTRDEMRQAIRDFLYSDLTGLPESYDEPEVEAKAEAVFAHMYRASPLQ